MDRAKFLKLTSIVGVGTVINPNSIFAQIPAPWLIELFEEFAKALLIGLIEKPIEDFLKEKLHLTTLAEEVRTKNDQYAQQNIYRKNVSLSKDNIISYPIATHQNPNRKGQYITPFYRIHDDQNYSHLGDFEKHEMETMTWAANHLVTQKGVNPIKNSKILLPNEPIQRFPFDGGIATRYRNIDDYDIVIYKYTKTLYASCSIQSSSFSPTKPTLLPRFELIT